MGEWVIIDKQEHVTKYGWDDGSRIEGSDPHPYYTMVAYVKWDGCVNLYQFYNGSEDEAGADTDYIHVCDMPEFASALSLLPQHIT